MYRACAYQAKKDDRAHAHRIMAKLAGVETMPRSEPFQLRDPDGCGLGHGDDSVSRSCRGAVDLALLQHLKEEPGAALGLIDPILQEARAREVAELACVCLISRAIRWCL